MADEIRVDKMVKTSSLQIGDYVRVFDFENENGTAVVTQIKDGLIYFFRPYVTTAEFTYTGGVIPYIGVEQFNRPVTDNSNIFLYKHSVLK